MWLAHHTRVGDSYSTATMAELLESLSKCLSQLGTFLLHHPKSGPPSLHLCLWDLLILTPGVIQHLLQGECEGLGMSWQGWGQWRLEGLTVLHIIVVRVVWCVWG